MTTRRSLILALASLLVAGCGDGGDGNGSAARIPSAAELAGTYDLTTTPDQDTPPVGGVGRVSGDLSIELSTPYVSLHGPLAEDGTATLEGMTLGTDAITLLTGQARAEQRDGVYRVSGRILNTGFSGPTTFVMERGVGADLRSKSGRYRITLAASPSSCGCKTTIDLDVVLTAAGTGTAASSLELDATGAAVGRTGDATVTVSPRGAFTLGADYGNAYDMSCLSFVPGAGRCHMTVQGILPGSSETSRDASFVVQDFFTFPVAAGAATVARLDE